jgi:hypoxanthine phosphoribosyltransferase
MKKRIITYVEYGNLLNKLIKKIENINVDYVYGIPRGGLPIAVHVSHYLDIPMINPELIVWDFYKDKKIIIVDDILDTGKSLHDTRQICMNHVEIKSIATLFKRPNIEGIDFFIEETSAWIIFPWETYEETPSEYHQDVYPELFRSKLCKNG